MKLELEKATIADVPGITALRNAVAEDLTARYGPGHWSTTVKEPSVAFSLRHAVLLVARNEAEIVGVLRLATRKPWAIDPARFRPVDRPLYLTDMAVKPAMQRLGIGRRLLAESVRLARDWPADAIRLDAYDAEAGGGGFYVKCGFREVARVTYRSGPLIYFEMLL